MSHTYPAHADPEHALHAYLESLHQIYDELGAAADYAGGRRDDVADWAATTEHSESIPFYRAYEDRVHKEQLELQRYGGVGSGDFNFAS